MSQEHHILVIPGLGDEVGMIEDIVKKHQFPGLVFNVSKSAQWKNKVEKTVQPKIKRISAEVTDLAKSGKVSIVGISASGSLAGLVYLENKNKIEKVVNVCGRLHPGGILVPFPPLWITSTGRPAFKDSVQTFEARQKELTVQDRRKFLVFQARVDELVPGSTSFLEGAKITPLPNWGHRF